MQMADLSEDPIELTLCLQMGQNRHFSIPESSPSCELQGLAWKIGEHFYFHMGDTDFTGGVAFCPPGSWLAKFSTSEEMANVMAYIKAIGDEGPKEYWVNLHNPSPSQECEGLSGCEVTLRDRGNNPIDLTLFSGEVKVKDDKTCVKVKESKLESSDCSSR